MLDVEDQISLVADAAMQRVTPGRVVPMPRMQAPRRRRLVLAVAAPLLVIVLITALIWVARNRSTSLPADQPKSAVDPATVDYPSDSTWLIPSFIPDGLVFVVAEDRHGFEQFLRYESGLTDEWLTVESGLGVTKSQTARASTEIDGRSWDVESIDTDPAWMSLTRVDGQIGVRVSAHGLSSDVLRKVAQSLAELPATQLRRPPLPVGDRADRGIAVAEGDQEGVPKQLFVNTDGVSFVFTVDGGSGASVRLGGAALVPSGALGPDPNSIGRGEEAESLIWGLLRSDVATVDVELTDGRVVTAQAQDLSGLFIENFYLIAVPTTTEGGLEMVSAVIARDRDGRELARVDGVFG